jgi:hypothetical protein
MPAMMTVKLAPSNGIEPLIFHVYWEPEESESPLRTNKTYSAIWYAFHNHILS